MQNHSLKDWYNSKKVIVSEDLTLNDYIILQFSDCGMQYCNNISRTNRAIGFCHGGEKTNKTHEIKLHKNL